MYHLMKISGVLLLCIVMLDLCEYSRGELFTAVCDIEPLLETHKRIIEHLDDYIDKEERRLDIVKRYINIYKREHEKAMEDVADYLGNPINAFTLIKRMTTDLELVKQTIEIGTEHVKNMTLTEYADMKYPTPEDLTGAAQALTRLQKTYHLDVADLAEGRLAGAIHRDDMLAETANNVTAESSSLTAGDCFELGRVLYNENDFTNALAWMTAALRKFKTESTAYSFTETGILEYISLSHSSLGNVSEALNWAKKILELDPNHSRAQQNLDYFQNVMQEEEEKDRQNGDLKSEKKEENEHWYVEAKKKYEALCRGEQEVSPDILKRLTCRYMNENPFLKIAPIKMEYKYLGPDIVLFHEVLTDEEIEHIKELSQPRFHRATVYDMKVVNYRISKSAWLEDEESEVVARVSRRVAHFTGLNLGTAEELQVVNYGIGGHYEPHFDFADKKLRFPESEGNRIATVLFYMSDVAQGGATVFTELGLSLFPVRGAAAVWLNLHASGEGDPATRHAACPVLRGSKWVCNKWIHTVGNEFIKPCGLEYQAGVV